VKQALLPAPELYEHQSPDIYGHPAPISDVGLDFLTICRLAIPFAALTLALFGKYLFQSTVVISHAGTDITAQFRYWRQLGFSELSRGHLVLWNPYNFCGYPFFGNWQTGLLYPPNWLHLFLPWPVAVNWLIATHFFLAGWMTAIWCRFRKISQTGSILAGLIAVGSGGFFLHIYAGHLPFLSTAPWTPLILLCVDGFMRDGWKSRKWICIAIFAAAMQLLAGYPQIVYYTALVAGMWILVQWPLTAPKRQNSKRGIIATDENQMDTDKTGQTEFDFSHLCPSVPICGNNSPRSALSAVKTHPIAALFQLAIVYIAAAAIAAMQIAAGLAATAESVRSGGTTFEMAASFSLPPENLLTLFIPHIFGDMTTLPYFGRWFLWESSLFIGAAGIALILCAMLSRKNKNATAATILAMVTGLLALGSYTPIFPALYKFIPLYGSFRGGGRFGFFTTTFLAMLAGIGYDCLRTGYRPRKTTPFVLLLPGAFLTLAAIFFAWQSQLNEKLWDHVIAGIKNTGESILPPRVYADSDFWHTAPIFINRQILISGICLFFAGGLLILSIRKKWLIHVLALAAVVEIVAYDFHEIDIQPANLTIPAQWLAPVAAVPAGSRVCIVPLPFVNSGPMLGQQDIFGYDPFIPKRFAQFMAASQGHDPKTADYSLAIRRVSPMYRTLRLILFIHDETDPAVPVAGALPRALIVHDWKLATTATASTAAMNSPDFDPTKTVMLESPPQPLPQNGPSIDSIKILRQSTDELEIQATLEKNGILLITDNYSTGWSVIPLDSSQSNFDVLPADWTLRAIPLTSGTHHFLLQFSPPLIRIGKYISLSSIPLYGVFIALAIIRKKNDKRFDICAA
jgi:hypothetical protein